jgi:hypothetical protein
MEDKMRSIDTCILRHIHRDNGTLMCRAHQVITGNSGDKLKEHIPSWLSIKSQDTQNSYLPASKYWYYNKTARRNLLSEMHVWATPFTARFILTLHNSDASAIIYITEFFSLQNCVLHNRWQHLSLCSNSWCLPYHFRGIICCYREGLYILKAVHPAHHVQ